jgi:amino acid permease
MSPTAKHERDTAPFLSTEGQPVKGSVEAGTAVLANTILGAGMLGLPFAFASCGFALGPLMLMLFATCSMSALILLSRCADKVGREQFPIFYDVASLAGKKLGLTNVGTVIDCFVAIKCLGVATSYLIVVGDSIPKALESFGVVGMLLDMAFAKLQKEVTYVE